MTSVADLPWRAESNGWGPVERDLSNGEKAAGIDVLELRVSGGGDGIDFDHADWGDARVSSDE